MGVKSRQEAADQSIQQIREQQDDLSRLLTGLQEALQAQLPADVASGCDQASAIPRYHQWAKVQTVQLEELDRQAEDLAKETESIQSTLYAEPLATIVRVLD